MNTNLVQQLQDIHVKAWNEKEATKRLELLQIIYAEDIKMYDRDLIIEGLTGIADFIATLISEDPAYSFAMASPLETLQNSARLYGHIQTSGGPLNSMDFFLIEDGKVKHLYAYMSPDTI